MPIKLPTESVGSLPRPSKLQTAYADYDAGKITMAQLEASQDAAVKATIAGLEAIESAPRSWHITDGEQRASSFATYPVTDTLNGTGLANGLAADGQYFAIFDDGHHRQLPRLVSGPFRYKTYAADYFRKSAPFASKGTKLKQAVISPSMLYLLYPLDSEIPGYSREAFLNDLVNEAEKDIKLAFDAGAERVSMDFTEGRLALKNDPRNPWTGRNILSTFIDLNNRVLDRFPAEIRKNIGIHTCPGGDCDSVHSGEVPYTSLLPHLFRMNAGYFLIQCASEKDKAAVYKSIGENIRKDANGVRQVAFVGVTNPLDPRVETVQEIREKLVEAAKWIPISQLGSTDDCGFSPFSIDIKPKHAGPDEAREVAFKKIAARVKGTREAGAFLSEHEAKL